MSMLQVVNLEKNYGNFMAVKGISFAIGQKEIFGLIGPNGAGKTTTLRVISTLLRMESGSVLLDGLDVAKEADEVRKIISYLPEDAGAYKNFTGRQYLEFMAAFFKTAGKTGEIVTKGIDISALKERIDSRVDTYSKGMVRRLLIGRALMVEPKLAILDEPSSGLDVINAQEVRKIITDSAKKGMAVLLSSHNMLEIEFLCDRVALINEGKIVETGAPRALKEKYGKRNIEEVFMEVVRCSSS